MNALCAELTKSGLDLECECALVHGTVENVAPPVVGKGMRGWGSVHFPVEVRSPVRLLRGKLPGPAGRDHRDVGLLRCYAVEGERRESSEDMLLYMDKQMADMAAMRRAIVCCNEDFDDIILGAYTPIGPRVVSTAVSGVSSRFRSASPLV